MSPQNQDPAGPCDPAQQPPVQDGGQDESALLRSATGPDPRSAAWDAAWKAADWAPDGVPHPDRLVRFINVYHAALAAVPRPDWPTDAERHAMLRRVEEYPDARTCEHRQDGTLAFDTCVQCAFELGRASGHADVGAMWSHEEVFGDGPFGLKARRLALLDSPVTLSRQGTDGELR